MNTNANSNDSARAPNKRSPWLRRGRLELLACAIIACGILMMLQPLAMVLFTWSFVTTLFGTVIFMMVSKLPE
jgi:hypothetical protein